MSLLMKKKEHNFVIKLVFDEACTEQYAKNIYEKTLSLSPRYGDNYLGLNDAELLDMSVIGKITIKKT